FLARREQEAGPLPFGRLDLHLWATAIKYPALADSPARLREPYGVAELFRQCLEQAAAFPGRTRPAGRRLFWAAAAAAGVVGLMVALGPTFAVRNMNTQASELQNRLLFILGEEATAAERLNHPAAVLRTREQKLTEVRNDPQFGSLSTEQKQ